MEERDTLPLHRAVFLDRDGVINRMVYDPEHGTVDSPSRPDQMELLPGVVQAIRDIRSLGFLAVVASNQPGVALGKYTMDLLLAINERMYEELELCGTTLDRVYLCLHHPEAVDPGWRRECRCRKPRPGLLLTAAQEMHIDLSTSYMVGDGLTDIQAGQAVGCATILIARKKCYECEECYRQAAKPDRQVDTLTKAVEYIKAREGVKL